MDEEVDDLQEMQQQETEGMEEVEVMDEEVDELPEGAEQEMQQQEADGIEGVEEMDEELEETSISDESGESSDSDELEELNPPPLQPPEAIVDDVRAFLPPLTSPSLVAERPPVQIHPCDRRADWSNLPIEALNSIYKHLPVSDIHVMGSVFDEHLEAGWSQRWYEEDLVLHDSQIHYGTYKDVKNYIRKHAGVVSTLRIDKLIFTSQNVRSWCRQLRKPEVTGPSEIILVNRGSPCKPLCLESVPQEILLPFNGSGLRKLHLCFFTLPRGGLHKYAALAHISELGLHGCAYDDQELTNGICAWLLLELLTLSFASQTMLCVESESMRELKLCNSSIRILDLRGAISLVRLSDLDLDTTALQLDHLLLRNLTVLEVMINYTAPPILSQVVMLQRLLNCFPCIEDLTIKRKDDVGEGQMVREEKCTYKLFADSECLTSHLKLLTVADFRGGKWEIMLIEALGIRAGKLSVLKVLCHESCSEIIRAEAAAILKEICFMSLVLDVSVC